ncbi:hypothetical protein HPG69_016483 [Diceros bicornis minor]|uniref:Uncharacterized protein n=1 Tax=Diceros bicornis minor TaxID=77932 RepID=A0A7J7EFG8_DICBM|nr:hypothetical protein HPG69_016483 [Diceros bicornis minor]
MLQFLVSGAAEERAGGSAQVSGPRSPRACSSPRRSGLVSIKHYVYYASPPGSQARNNNTHNQKKRRKKTKNIAAFNKNQNFGLDFQNLQSSIYDSSEGQGEFRLGFAFGNVVGMYLAQNYDIPNLAKKLEDIKKDLDAKKKPPSS